MRTPICPTCGCSLVRLGISKDQAVADSYEGQEHYFCCQGCLDLFVADPLKYLREIADLTVCPTCLGEKTPDTRVELEHGGQVFYFCRCPHCMEEFKKKPEYYIERLAGEGN